jgi:cold-inducible RNA-binding protein
MSANIYVGNLPFEMTNSSLQGLFTEFGEVGDARVILDRDTGRSRGFGFVEMPSSDEANKAISSLDGSEIGGRQLTVNLAKPKSR